MTARDEAAAAIRDALARGDKATAERILNASLVAPARPEPLPLPTVPVIPPTPPAKPKGKGKGKGKPRTPAEQAAGQAARTAIALLVATLAETRRANPHERWPAEALAPVTRDVPAIGAAGRMLTRLFYDEHQAHPTDDPDRLLPEQVAAAVWLEVRRLRRPVRLTRAKLDELLRRVLTGQYATVDLFRADATGREWVAVPIGLTRYQDSTRAEPEQTDDGPLEAWHTDDDGPLEAWHPDTDDLEDL